MDIYLETRGSARSTGYRFLGAGPGTRWWRPHYGERTAFEEPTILVERDTSGVRAYLGGIPSSRRDPGGTYNRTSIVLEILADAEVANEDRDLTLRLVSTWLRDIAEGREPGTLQRALDEAFPEETVARLYAEAPPGVVYQLVREAAMSLPSVAPDEDPARDLTPSWIAPMRSAAARAAFINRVRAILEVPDEGAAVLVNLVDTAESYALEVHAPPTAVLTTDPDGHLGDAPVPLTPKKALTPQPAGPAVSWTMRVPRWRVAAALVAAVVVSALIVWTLTNAGRTPGGGTAPSRTSPTHSPTPAAG